MPRKKKSDHFTFIVFLNCTHDTPHNLGYCVNHVCGF